PDAARRPRIPRPSILKSSISTPSDLMHEAVDCTSAPVDSPRTRLSPEAIEPNITARREMDLSPGTVIAPSSALAGATVAITPRGDPAHVAKAARRELRSLRPVLAP